MDGILMLHIPLYSNRFMTEYGTQTRGSQSQGDLDPKLMNAPT